MASAEETRAPEPLKVLIVDDNPTNVLVLETVLSLISAQTVAAHDGAMAVEAFRASAFDAVLMDLQMPVMDGLTATRLIREHEQATGQARTPVLVVTANTLARDVEDSLSAGADRHIAKPVMPMALLSALAETTGTPLAVN
ncbi:response regulator [Phenylobacterium sp. J367]|uniref:response regulator n=1 Tax=Phenylobacterium sp. J367 TaxID=2898435 RepID=UPI002151CF9F|nr:response regulator [Phenylobacterium sp. J367]MCR5877730.1 response regulator [Phenylobacterium sp. J367]